MEGVSTAGDKSCKRLFGDGVVSSFICLMRWPYAGLGLLDLATPTSSPWGSSIRGNGVLAILYGPPTLIHPLDYGLVSWSLVVKLRTVYPLDRQPE